MGVLRAFGGEYPCGEPLHRPGREEGINGLTFQRHAIYPAGWQTRDIPFDEDPFLEKLNELGENLQGEGKNVLGSDLQYGRKLLDKRGDIMKSVIVGCGGIAAVHAASPSQLGESELAGFADIKKGKSGELCR